MRPETSPPAPKVFISYSHDSEAHRRRILHLSNRLRHDGFEAWIDQYESAPPEGWPSWMTRQVEEAEFVLIAVSPIYAQRMMDPKPNEGKGVWWEGAIITQALYDAHGRNTKFIPIVLSSADRAFVPRPLRPYTCVDLEGPQGYETLYRLLTRQPLERPPTLGAIPPIEPYQNVVIPDRTEAEAEILASFTPEFLAHRPEETSVEDYYLWHEDFHATDSGELLSVTHRELESLWTFARYSVIYEVFVRRLLDSGGSASRVFVLGEEYVDPTTRRLLLHVLYRHLLLGFGPRVSFLPNVMDLRRSLLGIRCDASAVLSRRTGIFFRFPTNQYPLLVVSKNPTTIVRAVTAHKETEKSSVSFEEWYRNQPQKLSAAEIRFIEDEVQAILRIARSS